MRGEGGREGEKWGGVWWRWGGGGVGAGWVRGGVGGGWAGWVAPSMAADLGYSDATYLLSTNYLLLTIDGGVSRVR